MNKSKKAVLIALVSTAFLLGCGDEKSPEEELPTPTSKEVNCLLTTGECSKMKPATCLDLGGQSVERCPTGEDINCRLTSGQCSKMEAATCLELGGQKVEQCETGGSKNEITGDGALCSIGGKRAICQWDTGCYFVDSGWDKKPCTELIASCLENGKLFTAASLSEPDANMHKEKNGFQCANIGGTEFEGNLPGVSSPSGGNSSSSGGGGEDIDFCIHNGKHVFCEWPEGCFEQSSTYDPLKRTCSAIISNCFADGKVFTGVNSSMLTPGNEYGKGLKCADIGGTRVTSDGNSSSSGGGGEDIDFCIHNSKRVFCEWPDGCFEQSSTFDSQGRTCSVIIPDCFDNGQVFSGVNSSMLTPGNEYGKGLKCADIGGTKVTSDGSVGVTGDNGEFCRHNGKKFFCQYNPWQGEPGGCYAISYRYTPELGNCQTQYNNCIRDSGTIYYNVDNSLLTEANGHGKGLQCSTLGGTTY